MEELDLSCKQPWNTAESFRKKTLCEVNAVLSKADEHLLVEEINHIVNRTFRACTKNLSSSKEDQQLVFDDVCKFLNCLFQDVRIKKFYNNAPIVSLEDYTASPLGKKLLHVIYGKEWKLFYKDIITWGNCHHRTLILDHIFDVLQKKWLSLRKKIFIYKTDALHSFLLVEFDGKKYLADVFGENDDLGSIISPLETISQQPKNFFLSHLSLDKENHGFSSFDHAKDFTHELAKRETSNVRLCFKPNLDGNSQEIEITINSESMLFSLGDTNYTLFFDKKITLPKKMKGGQILDFLMRNAQWDKKSKQEISRYLSMIHNKIDPKKLYAIFNTHSNEN